MDIASIALALGSSLTAGLNLYITALALGFMHRYEFIVLPPGMEVLSHDWVLVVAGVLFLVEFVADKAPYVDNLWDSMHSFIRVPAGAILAVSSLGYSELPAHYLWIAALVGGFITFSAHGAKATTRLAVNTTPEPFSNWFLSLFEDGLSLGLLWLVSRYPEIAAIVVLFLLTGFLLVIYLFFHFFKKLFRRSPRSADRGADG
ncbi:MAG: DUF4126 domain-containing protein [Acidobacteriota bacterium]